MIVNILGTDYTVKLCKMGRRDYGDCDCDKKIIRLNRDKDQKAESFLHEVLHAALYESGVVHQLNATEGLEENIVRAVEHGLRSAELIPEFPADEGSEDVEA